MAVCMIRDTPVEAFKEHIAKFTARGAFRAIETLVLDISTHDAVTNTVKQLRRMDKCWVAHQRCLACLDETEAEAKKILSENAIEMGKKTGHVMMESAVFDVMDGLADEMEKATEIEQKVAAAEAMVPHVRFARRMLNSRKEHMIDNWQISWRDQAEKAAAARLFRDYGIIVPKRS